MIFNKSDFEHFLNNVFGYDVHLCNSLKDKIEFSYACLQDYLFYGGQICNKHGVYHCRKCKPKRFFYVPDFSLGEYNLTSVCD